MKSKVSVPSMSLKSAAFAAVCVSASLAAPKAEAQIYTWDGGSASSNNWSDANNWTSTAPLSSYSSEIRMMGANRKTNSNNLGTMRTGRLLLDGSNWFLSGNAFEFQGGGKIDSLGNNNLIANNLIFNANPNNNKEVNVNVGIGNNLTLSGNISGLGTIAMVASGILNLNGTNTNTGGLNAYFGTVNAATGALGGPINIQNPATLNWSVATNTNWDKLISGSGLINKTGSGQLNLTGANTFSGIWKISNGTIGVNNVASLGTGSVYFDGLNTSTLAFGTSSGTFYGDIESSSINGTPNHNIVVQSGSNLSLLGKIDGAVKVALQQNSYLKVSAKGITNRMEVNGPSKLEINYSAGNSNYLFGNLYGNGQVIKTGDGTLGWNNSMTDFTGTMTIQEGALDLFSAEAFSQTMDIGANGKVYVGYGTFDGTLIGSGTLIYIAGSQGDYTKAQNGFSGVFSHEGNYVKMSDFSFGTGEVRLKPSSILDYISAGGVSPLFKLTGNGTVNFKGTNQRTKLLNGNQAFAGTMNVKTGALNMATTNSSGFVNIDAGATFGFDQNTNGTNSAIISGAGKFEKRGTGEVTVHGSYLKNFTGDIDLIGGGLRLKDSDFKSNLILGDGTRFIFDTTTNRDWQGNLYNYGGTFVKEGAGTLSVTDKEIDKLEVNQGTVYVKPGTLSNYNTVIGQMGRLRMGGELSSMNSNLVTNSGEISGTGRLGANINNTDKGRIVVGGTDTMQLQGMIDNSGSVQLTGGTLQVEDKINNKAGGLISGRGVLRTAGYVGGIGLFNQGAASFSAGLTDVFGDVSNMAGGQILTVGGGTTTFHDDVIHNGAEIRTAAGSRTVFLGGLSGAGNFTGTGTVEIQGDLRPGNSPAHVTFAGDLELGQSATTTMELGGLQLGTEYDSMTIMGTAHLGGDLNVKFINGFSSSFGDTFQLFTGNLDGEFGSMTLPTLQNGLYWDTSKLYSEGKIQTVPEPAGLAVIGIGVVTILKRRKKLQSKKR